MEVPAYYLYLPPTPIKARFVMLEESTKTFYDVDTITSELGNPSTWTYLGLSPSIVGQRPAIIIPNRLNDDWQKRLIEKGRKENVSVNPNFEVGRLVSVERQEGNVVFAKILGKVNICPCKPNVMSWEGLKDEKWPSCEAVRRNQ